MNPDYGLAHYYLGSALLQVGEFSAALEQFNKAYEREKLQQITALIGFTYGVMGKQDASLTQLKKLRTQSRRKYVSPYTIALIYSGLGRVDQAFKWLEKAYVEGAAWLVFLKIDPGFDRLRSDSRFSDLLQRIGFE